MLRSGRSSSRERRLRGGAWVLLLLLLLLLPWYCAVRSVSCSSGRWWGASKAILGWGDWMYPECGGGGCVKGGRIAPACRLWPCRCWGRSSLGVIGVNCEDEVVLATDMLEDMDDLDVSCRRNAGVGVPVVRRRFPRESRWDSAA